MNSLTNIQSTIDLAKKLEARSKAIQKELAVSIDEVKRETEAWEDEKRQFSEKFSIKDNIIELNVGGTFYTTYKSVLCKEKPSMLEAMFSGRHHIVKDFNGRYFIDCDGESFGYILNFLRRGEMVWPSDLSLKKRVTLDLNFFGLPIPYFVESSIIKQGSTIMEHLTKLFPDVQDTHLLYRASSNGWTSQNFHERVRDKFNTVTLIRVNNYIFGGFIPHKWNSTSNGNYVASHPNSFLFSLSNPSNTLLGTKIPNTGTNGNYSNYYNESYGPTFGGGYDICIYSNANANTSSSTNLGHSYTHPNYSYDSDNAKKFFCGSYNFTPNEVEVFSIIF